MSFDQAGMLLEALPENWLIENAKDGTLLVLIPEGSFWRGTRSSPWRCRGSTGRCTR